MGWGDGGDGRVDARACDPDQGQSAVIGGFAVDWAVISERGGEHAKAELAGICDGETGESWGLAGISVGGGRGGRLAGDIGEIEAFEAVGGEDGGGEVGIFEVESEGRFIVGAGEERVEVMDIDFGFDEGGGDKFEVSFGVQFDGDDGGFEEVDVGGL